MAWESMIFFWTAQGLTDPLLDCVSLEPSPSGLPLRPHPPPGAVCRPPKTAPTATRLHTGSRRAPLLGTRASRWPAATRPTWPSSSSGGRCRPPRRRSCRGRWRSGRRFMPTSAPPSGCRRLSTRSSRTGYVRPPLFFAGCFFWCLLLSLSVRGRWRWRDHRLWGVVMRQPTLRGRGDAARRRPRRA